MNRRMASRTAAAPDCGLAVRDGRRRRHRQGRAARRTAQPRPGRARVQRRLQAHGQVPGQVPGVEPVLVTGGWPKDESVFEGAKARSSSSWTAAAATRSSRADHLEKIQKLMDKGVGLACLHYAVEVPKGKPGDKFLDWIGGYYETGYSTNPHWKARRQEAARPPDHAGRASRSPSTTSGISTSGSAPR